MMDRAEVKQDVAKVKNMVFHFGLLSCLWGLLLLHSSLHMIFDDGKPYRAHWLMVVVSGLAFFFSFFMGWKLSGTILFLRGSRAKIPPENAGEGEAPKTNFPVYDLRELVGTRRRFASLELHFADGSKENLRDVGMFPWTKKKLKNELDAIIARNKADSSESSE